MNSVLRNISLVVSGIGWAVSVYIYFAHQLGNFVCPVGDCITVNKSEYAQISSIPVSLLGIVFYLVVLSLLFGIPFLSNKASRWMLGLVLGIGLIFSLYLTYAEIFWIHAICFWCMVSLGCVIVLNILFWMMQRGARGRFSCFLRLAKQKKQ
jgi:uncharacterized membrane protein